jgi:hypothetical protein
LTRFLQDGQRAGRRVLHLADGFVDGGLVVPLLGWTAEANHPPVPATMPLPVLVAIRTGDPEAGSLAIRDRSARAVLKRLVAAAQRDVRALSMSEVNDDLVLSDRSAARRLAREGRLLWRQLGAWPWWQSPTGPLPTEWWREPHAVETLFLWRFGSRQLMRDRQTASV